MYASHLERFSSHQTSPHHSVNHSPAAQNQRQNTQVEPEQICTSCGKPNVLGMWKITVQTPYIARKATWAAALYAILFAKREQKHLNIPICSRCAEWHNQYIHRKRMKFGLWTLLGVVIVTAGIAYLMDQYMASYVGLYVTTVITSLVLTGSLLVALAIYRRFLGTTAQQRAKALCFWRGTELQFRNTSVHQHYQHISQTESKPNPIRPAAYTTHRKTNENTTTPQSLVS